MNRIKKLRNQIKMSVYSLADYVDIDPSVISLLENGKRKLREEHINSFCRFFDVTSDYLLGNSNEGIGYYTDKNSIDSHLYLSEEEFGEMISRTPSYHRLIRIENGRILEHSRVYSDDIQFDNLAFVQRFSDLEFYINELNEKKKFIENIQKKLILADKSTLEIISEMLDSVMLKK